MLWEDPIKEFSGLLEDAPLEPLWKGDTSLRHVSMIWLPLRIYHRDRPMFRRTADK